MYPVKKDMIVQVPHPLAPPSVKHIFENKLNEFSQNPHETVFI